MSSSARLPATFYNSAPMRESRTTAMRYLRDAGKVFQAGAMWYITTYEGVRFAQRHPELFSSAQAFDAFGAAMQMIPLAVDPPDHRRYRRILDPMFGPRRMAVLEPALRAQVRAHIDAFAPHGHCDVMADLAAKFPTQAILTLLGLPLQDLPDFLRWAGGLIDDGTNATETGEPTERQIAYGLALFDYLQRHLAGKRENPGDDVISELLALTGGDAWTDAELLGMCFTLVLAGLDTVTSSIGFCMLRLAQDAELRRRLQDDPELIPDFIEEVLRLDGPAVVVPRRTTTEVEVEGVTIPAGAQVALVLGTANRDGPHADHADALTFGARTTHLAFGGGVHRCLGAHLARTELTLMIEEFHTRIPDYELAGIATVKWPSATVQLETLPLRFPTGQRPSRQRHNASATDRS